MYLCSRGAHEEEILFVPFCTIEIKHSIVCLDYQEKYEYDNRTKLFSTHLLSYFVTHVLLGCLN